MGDREEIDDVLPIASEFLQSVWEGKYNGSNSSVPGNGPVSSVLDSFSWFDGSKRYLKLSELLDLEVVICCGELPAEYRSNSFKTTVIDTIVAEIQSVPGEDRCVLLLGYRNQMMEMFQVD